MPAEQALHYFQQILAGVSYLHQSQIVHRDLKLENILRDTDETVKICDFGFATWHAKGDPLLRTACGSPYYASPEILSLVPYDGALADIWSLGVILFALLVGKMPFEGQTTSDTMLKIRMNQCQIPNTIDPVAADLLKRIFVKDPRKRITVLSPF
jgi:serine/threonine-protein kinase HSL1 (negative regulator of Swe1 kinase)